jgi:hypothetical protein
VPAVNRDLKPNAAMGVFAVTHDNCSAIRRRIEKQL